MPIRLLNGVPSRGLVGAGEWEHFVYSDWASEGDLSFMVTSYSGDVSLFVSTDRSAVFNNTELTSPTAGVPWMSDKNGSALEIVDIPENSPHRCTQACNYYIAVHGKELSSFNIRAFLHFERRWALCCVWID